MANSLQKTGVTLTLTRAKSGVWCDYCKVRFGTASLKGQTPAAWTTTCKRHGKVIVRSYCQTCANEIQTRHDGSTWLLADQIEYAKGKERLDVQFE